MTFFRITSCFSLLSYLFFASFALADLSESEDEKLARRMMEEANQIGKMLEEQERSSPRKNYYENSATNARNTAAHSTEGSKNSVSEAQVAVEQARMNKDVAEDEWRRARRNAEQTRYRGMATSETHPAYSYTLLSELERREGLASRARREFFDAESALELAEANLRNAMEAQKAASAREKSSKQKDSTEL